MAAQPRKRERTSFTLDPDLVEALKDGAWTARMNYSRYVEHALRTYLAEHPPVPPAD